MAETVLYQRLKNYNRTIDNNYKDQWGTLVAFLPGDDTQYLTKLVKDSTKDMDDPNQLAKRKFNSLDYQKRKTKQGQVI